MDTIFYLFLFYLFLYFETRDSDGGANRTGSCINEAVAFRIGINSSTVPEPFSGPVRADMDSLVILNNYAPSLLQRSGNRPEGYSHREM
jgi:hypothetical protein